MQASFRVLKMYHQATWARVIAAPVAVRLPLEARRQRLRGRQVLLKLMWVVQGVSIAT